MKAQKVEKVTTAKTIAYSLMWIILIATVVMTCGRGEAVEETEGIIITDELVMWASDRFIILPKHPDTLQFVITGTMDDNTLTVYCETDSTYHWMEVESAYIPQYYEGNSFTLIQID